MAKRARTRVPRSDEPSEWLSTRQVADYLDCTVDWLYHLAAVGVGPPRRQLGGKRWKYLRRDVDEWVQAEPDLSAASTRQRAWYERHKAEMAELEQGQRTRQRRASAK